MRDGLMKTFDALYKCGWPDCPCDPFEGYIECDGRGGPRIPPEQRRPPADGEKAGEK